MNIKNNKRKKESIEKIESAFMELLETKELNEITVSQLCSITGLNRSTFYANFIDVYDLADKLRYKLEHDFALHFQKDDPLNEVDGALKMFRHIYEHQPLYRVYFKLGYADKNTILTYDIKRAENDFDNKNLKYHIEFFRNGINAIIKMWLGSGCAESPEEMAEILKSEYRGR